MDEDSLESIIEDITSKVSKDFKLPQIKKTFRPSNSFVKEAEFNSKSWTQKKFKSKTKGTSEVISAIFELLEKDPNGKASALKIVEQMITLGFSSDPASLINVSFT